MRNPTPPLADSPHVLFHRRRAAAEQLKFDTFRRIDEDEKAFNELIAAFDKDPVVILPEALINTLSSTYRIDAVKILETHAKAADRFFVELWRDHHGDHRMTVKTTGPGETLTANLLLIAKEASGLTVQFKTKTRTFRFRGAEGKKYLDAWLEHCRTDIRAQFALNFGPAITQLPEFDEEGNLK